MVKLARSRPLPSQRAAGKPHLVHELLPDADLQEGRAQSRGGRMAKIKKVSEADLKKRILAVEADRLKNPSELRPDHAARSRLEKSRAAAEKMMAHWMTGAGLDIDKLRSAHEAREAELGRLVEAHRRDALGQAAKLR